MNGYVKISREMLDHPVVGEGNIAWMGAWVWMLGKACWKPRRFSINGKVVELQRGQLCVSYRQLAEEWDWSKGAVERFFEKLKLEDMVRTETGTGRTVVTICNYSTYQDSAKQSGTPAGQKPGHQRDTNKEGKKKEDTSLRSVSIVQSQFDEFWKRYPRKDAKQEARAEFEKALAKTDLQTLCRAIDRQTEAMFRHRERKHVPQAQRWLRRERWLDEVHDETERKDAVASATQSVKEALYDDCGFEEPEREPGAEGAGYSGYLADDGPDLLESSGPSQGRRRAAEAGLGRHGGHCAAVPAEQRHAGAFEHLLDEGEAQPSRRAPVH